MKMSTSLLRFVALLVILSGWLVGASSTAYGQGGGETPRLDILVIVDESGSMWFETDVDGERLDAFNLLIDTLGSESAVGDKVRVSVIAFGSAELTELILPFTEVNAETVEYIKGKYYDFHDNLGSPPDGEIVGLRWTDAQYALELAGEVLTNKAAGHLPDHKPAIIILSDGKPETADINESVDDFEEKLDPYIDQIFSEASEFQSPPDGLFYYKGACPPLKKGWVPIYTVAVREGARLPANYQEIWRRLAEQNGGAYHANPEGLSLGPLGNTYYQIWTEIICQEDRMEPVTLPWTDQYRVSNLYKRVVFTVLKADPEVKFKVYRPGSDTPMPEDDPSLILNQSLRDEVWSIGRSEPWAGDWTVELTGEGQVWFAYEPFAEGVFQVEQLSPTSNFVKACNPIDVALTIASSEGIALTDNVQSFRLEVETPLGESGTFEDIQAADDDVFRLRYENTCLDGEYRFSGVFHISDEGLTDEGLTFEWPWNDTIVAILDPYMDIVSPVSEHYTNEPIPLQVDIRVGKDIDPNTATRNPPIAASVYEDTKKVAGPFNLAYAGDLGPARMMAEIPADTLAPGIYTAEFTWQSEGNQAPEVRRSEFSVKEAPTPAPLPTPTHTPVPPTSTPLSPEPSPMPTPPPPERPSGGLIAGILGALALLGVLVGAWLWYRQLPRLLPLALVDSLGDERHVRGRFGGKGSETQSFTTTSGDTVKLRFSPAQDLEGQRATQVTLLSDIDPVNFDKVMVDGEPLSNKGAWALITDQSQRLTIDREVYDIHSY